MQMEAWYWPQRYFIYGDEVLKADALIDADGATYVSCMAVGDERSFVPFADIADATFFESVDLAQSVLTRINAAADAAE